MAFKLAEAFVEIGAKMGLFRQGLSQAKAEATQFHSHVGGLLAGVGAGLGLGLAGGGLFAIGAAIKQTITGASDLNEALNKTKVIFGDASSIVEAKAKQMADDFGIVKTQWLDTSSEVGNLLMGMGGMGQKASAELSSSLGQAAADASSIFNKEFPDAIGKITSALRGQSEPISEFGIDVQEAAVKQEAMRLGLVRGNKELTTQQKVAARASVILKGLKQAAGDLANTQDGWANSFRAVWGRIQNTLAEVGKALMPIYEGMVHQVNRVLKSFQKLVDAGKPYLESFAEQTVYVGDYVKWMVGQVAEALTSLPGRISEFVMSFDTGRAAVEGATKAIAGVWNWLKDTAGAVFDWIGFVWRHFTQLAEVQGIRARMLFLNIGEAVTYLGGVFGAFLEWFGQNWRQVFSDALNAVLTMFQNLGENFASFGQAVYDWIQSGFQKDFSFAFKPLLEGFESTVSKLPEIAGPVLTDLQGEIDALTFRMGLDEQAYQEGKPKGGPATKATPQVGDRIFTPETKQTKPKFEDLTSFAKRLQEGALGGSVQDQQLKIQKQQLAVQQEQLKETKKGGKPAPAVAT
jgi:hypothetical protein